MRYKVVVSKIVLNTSICLLIERITYKQNKIVQKRSESLVCRTFKCCTLAYMIQCICQKRLLNKC